MESEAQIPFISESRAAGNLALEGLAPSLGDMGRSRMFSLPRQNSVYSLTLDEFQNTIVDSGKSFGSMNMDEFLKNIWTVEESQAMAAAMGGNEGAITGLITQPSLPRQASLTLPRTLSRKTVDEVWRGIQQAPAGYGNSANNPADEQDKQLTFGEMTLEDFLIKAGVFREEIESGNQSFVPYGGGLGNKPSIRGGMGTAFAKQEGGGFDSEIANAGSTPTFSLSPVSALASQSALDGIQPNGFELNSNSRGTEWMNGSYKNASTVNQQKLLQNHVEATAYLKGTNKMGENAMGNAEMSMGGGMGALGGTIEGGLVGGFGGRNLGINLGTGLGGGMRVAGGLGLGTGSPPSPLSDGIGPGNVNDFSFSLAGNYGLDVGLRGRKRRAEGPVEKLIERRQKRMIKNRESAARSRARKQVWKVFLPNSLEV
ncbi:hypothetical protein O6H91_11G039000 [Diphasiastrum complanatum]|uniref:Uncharacterized protein n=1 Tax=Diphasiastrum complanatum TaxID=34168 RepID=A0ACC2C867_DIPCM|nr:hypothetical protein O6H91_11G039000 [Diphasiastrum complanatum]